VLFCGCYMVSPQKFHCAVQNKLTLDESPDFLDLPLDCQGYCIATLVYCGILTPGNPMLGVVKAKGRHFVFQRDEYLEYFVANPDFFLQKMTEQCFASPHIIHMLQLEDFPLQSLAKLVQNTIVSQADECVETPLHFADSNVDKTYEWNCWTMRKTALQMANIRQMKTSSAQTILSNFRRENEGQTYPPKDARTNTDVEKGTNPVRLKCYVTGLRDSSVQSQVIRGEFE